MWYIYIHIYIYITKYICKVPYILWNQGHKVYGQGKWGQTLNTHLGRMEASMQVLQPAQNDSLKKAPHAHVPQMDRLTMCEDTLPNSLSSSKRQTGHSDTQHMTWNEQMSGSWRKGWPEPEQGISKIIPGVGNIVLKTCALSKEK